MSGAHSKGDETTWLDVIGIGEDGLDGLTPEARRRVTAAQVIIGGDRHHALATTASARRLAWPSPFDAMIEAIRALRGQRAVVLVTGDPLWYSVGARLLKAFSPEELRFHPQVSAFQLAACRLKWSLADLETLTLHGRPPAQMLPFLAPGLRVLLLTKDRTTPPTVARLLTARGFGPSRLTVLGALGGPHETRIDGRADAWAETDPAAPDFHVLAVELDAAPGTAVLPRTGLPDDAFAHDGKMTKREARALALAKLAPRRGQTLWDVGCGCGSIAVEWMRADRDMTAVGFEPHATRRALAAENAENLGAPRLRLIAGSAPDALGDPDLPRPDAVFLGGGLSEATIVAALAALRPFGRLVAHAVTLESETVLCAAHQAHGGELTRLAISRAEPVGPYRGWRPSMPVTQWSVGA